MTDCNNHGIASPNLKSGLDGGGGPPQQLLQRGSLSAPIDDFPPRRVSDAGPRPPPPRLSLLMNPRRSLLDHHTPALRADHQHPRRFDTKFPKQMEVLPRRSSSRGRPSLEPLSSRGCGSGGRASSAPEWRKEEPKNSTPASQQSSLESVADGGAVLENDGCNPASSSQHSQLHSVDKGGNNSSGQDRGDGGGDGELLSATLKDLACYSAMRSPSELEGTVSSRKRQRSFLPAIEEDGVAQVLEGSSSVVTDVETKSQKTDGDGRAGAVVARGNLEAEDVAAGQKPAKRQRTA